MRLATAKCGQCVGQEVRDPGPGRQLEEAVGPAHTTAHRSFKTGPPVVYTHPHTTLHWQLVMKTDKATT